MSTPPNILLTGVNGVGKSTILNLFPGEIVLEIDDNFNEIIQKSIKIENVKKINECLIREIDLRELLDNFNKYYNIISITDIICLVLDSTERNIIESQDLLLKLRENVPEAKYFIIANFQDRKSISWEEDKIENTLKLKVFGFSAIQEDSEQLMNYIIKEILKISFKSKKKDTNHFISNEEIESIWSNIQEAIIAESNQDYRTATKLFSTASLKIKNLNLESADFDALFYLCKAWHSLVLGHQDKNIQKFAEAEIFFNQANEQLKDKKQKNLLYASSIFCEILNLSTQFDELETLEREELYYPKIHNLIKRAIEFYHDGGFSSEMEWAKSAIKKLKL